jgi:predicted nucleotidyltransferase
MVEQMQLPSTLLSKVAAEHPYPLLFATVSGAHLYGFPSQDSDFDLRGVHILPVKSLIALDHNDDTVTSMNNEDGCELDLVTHDIKKFFLLLLKKNGYVLEQLFSPLVVSTTKEHLELQDIARGCVTKFHSHHYLGFSQTQWHLFVNQPQLHVKPLLYVYRVLLTGIHLMRTGEIEANLVTLNQEFELPYIDELIERKKACEDQTVEIDLQFHESEFVRLRNQLEDEAARSTLDDKPNARPALEELLVRCRLKYDRPH